MLIYGLDINRKHIAFFNPDNVQLNRRYYTYGDFIIQIPFNQFVNGVCYIYIPDKKQLCIVNKTVYKHDSVSKYIQFSGFFAEKLLDNYVLVTDISGSAKIGNVALELLKNVVIVEQDKMPPINIGSIYEGDTISYSYKSNDGVSEIGKILYSLLETQQLSYNLEYDFKNDKFIFNIYKGLNRTQEQNTNSWIVFSTGFNNIDNLTYTVDNSNYKNMYTVNIPNSEGGISKLTYDFSEGDIRRRLVVNLSGTYGDGYDENAVKQTVLEKSMSYKSIINIELTPNLSFYKYGVDYDLGDECDIIIDDINIHYKSRITSIYEVYKGNNKDITVELGDTIPTMLMKARL